MRRFILFLYVLFGFIMGQATEVSKVTPSPESKIKKNEKEIVVEFSAPVEVKSALMKYGWSFDYNFIQSVKADASKTKLSIDLENYQSWDKLVEFGSFSIRMTIEDESGQKVRYGSIPDMVTLDYVFNSNLNTFELISSVPANQATLKTLKLVTLTYGQDGGLYISGIAAGKNKISLLNDQGSPAAEGLVRYSNEKEITIEFADEIIEKGTYTLTIPEGLVYDNTAMLSNYEQHFVDLNSTNTASATFNPETSLTFHIEGRKEPVTVRNILPNPDVKQPSVQNVEIEFTGPITPKVCWLYYGTNNNVNLAADDLTVNNNRLTIDLSKYAADLLKNDPCIYTLMMQATDTEGNFITYGDEPNYITMAYTVEAKASEKAQMDLLGSDPENGSTVKVLSQIKLKYGDGILGIYANGIDQAKEMGEVINANTGESVCQVKFSSYSTTEIECQLLENIETPGTYSIAIPEGLVWDQNATIRDWDNYYVDMDNLGDATCNKKVTLTYHIEGEIGNVSVVAVDPISGSWLDKIEKITIDFSAEVTPESCTLELPNAENIAVENSNITITDKTLSVDLSSYSEQLTTTGSFTMLLRVKDTAGNYVTYGEQPDFIKLQYMVNSSPTGKNTLVMLKSDPANGASVESFSRVTMTFGNAQDSYFKVGGIDQTKEYAAIIEETSGKVITRGKFVSMSMNDVACILEQEILDPGTYKITIPEALVWDQTATIIDQINYYVDTESAKENGSTYNPEFTYRIKVLGGNSISTIEQKTEEVNAYSLQGVFVGKGKVAELLKTLDKGVYIIGGKKMVVF